MKTYISIAIILLFGTLQAQDSNYVKSLVDELAGPSYFGRGYINEGDRLAAERLQAEFEKIGLNPVQDTYLMPYVHSVNKIEGCEVTVTYPSGERRLEPGIEYLVRGGSPSLSGSFKIIHIDSLMLLNGTWMQQVLRAKKNQAIWVHAPTNSRLSNEKKELVSKVKNILYYAKDMDQRLVVWEQPEQLVWSPSNHLAGRSMLVLESVSSERAEKIEVDIEAFFMEEYTSYNVMGMLPGTKPDSIILVTAHFDHLGMMGDVMFPGAFDNATGTAMMLDLARELADDSLHYSYMFVGFSGEEIGLRGSQAFVESPPFDLSHIAFQLNFDLVYKPIGGATAVNGKVLTDPFEWLENANIAGGYVERIKARGEACNSDHCPFTSEGVPGFFLYTNEHYPWYHHVNDKPENISYEGYEAYLKLMMDFVREIERHEAIRM